MRQVRQASATIRSGALGLLAGFVGSLCCLGPSAAILLGLGSSSALAGLAFDRTLALAGGGALLAIGLLLARRQARACAVPRATRWRAPALILLTFILAYGLLGYLLPALAERQADASATITTAASAPQAPASLRRATLLVEKMYCPPCAAHVRGALGRKPYIHGFVAETNNEEVTVDYDSQQAGVRAIVSIFPSSFRVKLLSDQPLP
jgi:copper chaperone CopZ